MKRQLASTIESYSWFKSLFDIYKAFRVAGSAVLRNEDRIAPDGYRIPGLLLLVSTTGSPDPTVYLESGMRAEESITQAVASQQRGILGMIRILDFGCGCGRVLRQWRSLPTTEIYGVDIDRRAVKWCRKHLPFARVASCDSDPPLQFSNEHYELIYALSVLTHLTEDLQKAWLAEWLRLLKPGGLLVFSVHGNFYRDKLSDDERAIFDAGKLVVRNPGSSGTNRCGTYHPLAYVTEHLTTGYELLQHIPCGARGNPEQDLYVLSKVFR